MIGIPNMIQNGSFGMTQPMMGGYNPYAGGVPPTGQFYNQPMMMPQQQDYGNMIPIGSYNYNNTAFGMQQPQQQYTFQPAMGGYNPNPYGRYAGMQRQDDYYNPFPQFQQQSALGYFSNPYQGYNNYSPFMSMQQRQNIVSQQVQLAKIKARISCSITGLEYDEEVMDKLYNPNNQVNVKTPEEIDADRQWQEVQRFHYFSVNPTNIDYPERHLANFMQLQIKNYHEAFDSHSLCEFIEEDYPRLQREIWISENIKKNATRDLSQVYSSRDYNDLLAMHRSSNPYINAILDESRFDNNLDDAEIGLQQIFERERRRRNVLEGKLPTYISSPEVQESRRRFTEELIGQIYHKRGVMPDVPNQSD